MIKTKEGKPVIEIECVACKEGGLPIHGVCEYCKDTGCHYTRIPEKYIKEVERLLKVYKPDDGDFAAVPEPAISELQNKDYLAQKRLKELEQLILNP